jgi:hypothetical protein
VSAKEIPLLRELLYEAARALPHLRLFRRNVLKLKVIDSRTNKDRMVIAGIPGQCDLYGYIYGGRVIEVELKSQNGRLTTEQRAWRDWCLAGQIPWVCLWPWPNEAPAQTVRRWVAAVALLAGPSPTPTTTLAPPLGAPLTDRTPERGSRRSRDLRGSDGRRPAKATSRSARST